jgi:hypothetical protein
VFEEKARKVFVADVLRIGERRDYFISPSHHHKTSHGPLHPDLSTPTTLKSETQFGSPPSPSHSQARKTSQNGKQPGTTAMPMRCVTIKRFNFDPYIWASSQRAEEVVCDEWLTVPERAYVWDAAV